MLAKKRSIWQNGDVFVNSNILENFIEIHITDTGIGILEQDFSRVFNKFKRAINSDRKQQDGVGIGLSITKTLIELHGGYINFKSKVGVGTTFSVGFPLKRAKDFITDRLTDLYTYEYFVDRMKKDIATVKRYKEAIVIVRVDIDDFASINYTYDFAFGNKILTTVAELLSTSIRFSDLLARSGGGEFIITLFKTDEKKAAVVCERIRKSVAEHIFLFEGNQVTVTVSIGGSYLYFQNDDPRLQESNEKIFSMLTDYAQEALRISKANGKNRYTIIPYLMQQDHKAD